ncbi:MAG TPA: FG-GAP-like repeat-containing protein [Saprospiraceae bacterium]|nr:FG-GAP-like repeat-containing protein [Saprospiraceae bacterium]
MFRRLISLITLSFCTFSGYAQDFVTYKYSPNVYNNGYAGIADFDLDGNKDILNVKSFSFSEFYIHHHDGTLPINFKATKILQSSYYSAAFDIVDKDADGDMDILTVKGNKIVFLVNKSTPGKFLFEIESLPITFITKTPILFSVDINKDNNMDIVVGDMTGKIKVFYYKSGSYVEYDVDFIQPAPVEGNLHKLRLADINGDGLTDLVAGSLFGEKKGLIVYINEGQSFKPLIVADKITIRDIQVLDFDHDGDVDIISCGNIGNAKTILWWENDLNITNKFVPMTLVTRNYDFDGFNAVDLNQDGAWDIVASLKHQSDSNPGGLSLYISNGKLENITFTENKIPDIPKDVLIESMLVSDVDNDGDQDFVTYTEQLWVENRLNTSSTDESKLQSQIILNPNPASDQIQFNITKPMDTKIWTSTGSLVYSKQVHPNENINISKLSSGLYFVTLDDGSGRSVSLKFVK